MTKSVSLQLGAVALAGALFAGCSGGPMTTREKAPALARSAEPLLAASSAPLSATPVPARPSAERSG
jgi:outer membrane murein-binding lipoprotein Lpp